MAHAEALAIHAVEVILKTISKQLISLSAQEISLLWGLNKHLEKFSDSVRLIEALLQDAAEKEIENRSVRIWIENLKDLAYEAEDLLDEVGYEVVRRKTMIRSPLKKVSSFFDASSSNPILFRSKMAHRLKNINEKLEMIRTESSGLGLVGIRYVETRIEETDSYLDNSEVVGRNDEVSTILDMITQNSSNFMVIPIVGMAGLGKTTLAKLLSKRVDEFKLFDKSMWVCVSNYFDERMILRGMLESLDMGAGRIDNMDALLKHLRENLKDKSFFLVLDDLWNEEPNKWDSLMNRLSKINGSRKNCIVITTRSEGVASVTETTLMGRYYPTKLSDGECWSIIKEKAFGKAFEEIPQDLTDIGRDIARKCAGLPLLARVLGGTMRLRTDSTDWSSIRDNAVWSTFTENGEILPVLKLSFDRLSSSSLKQCFGYCAIFPEDHVIEKDKLIPLWIAQGYIHHDPRRHTTVEDAGEEHFKILLANSFFQDVEKDEFENIRSCKMHDALHGLAEFVSRSEIWIPNSMSTNDISNTRHIRLNSGEILTKLEKVGRRKIRSLFSDVEVDKNALRGLKGMRVLDIHGFDTTVLSTTFVESKHLRYLDISSNTVSIQPRSITRFCNLEALRFVNCHGLKEPLAGIKHLMNLKHIVFDDPDLTPSYIGKLTSLQTLSFFSVDTKKGRGIEELGSLKHLRGELELQKLENVKGKSNASEADIKGKLKLQKLTYGWSKCDHMPHAKDVLEGLEPHPHLVGLTISRFGGESFSSWLSDHHLLGRLRRLELIEVLDCVELPTLGEMSCLECLVINNLNGVKRIGTEFYTRDLASVVSGAVTLFPLLKKFEIFVMSELEEWVEPIEEGITIFPSLEELSIHACWELQKIPVIQSKSLRKLSVFSCLKLTTLPVSHEGANGSVLVDLDFCFSGISILPTFSNSIQKIVLSDVPNLTILPENLGDLTCMVNLEIQSCKALTNMPTRLQSCKSLQVLSIANCKKLENVPENLEEMASLEALSVVGCPKLIRVGNLPFCHQRLSKMNIGGFREMDEFPNLDDRVNSSVRYLTLKGWHGLRYIPYLQHFTVLKNLGIYDFEELEVLPFWLGNLSSLVKLRIRNCKILKSLPESIKRLTNLKEFEISGCPILMIKLSIKDITEYSKISHIESIKIFEGTRNPDSANRVGGVRHARD